MNLDFLKSEYGNSLKSAIVHFDESHPHIHFYCHPNLDDENRLNIRNIHVGMKLRDSVPDKGVGSGKLRSRLYKQAMRDQQDRYYQVVGINCGLARIGPKNRKLTRKEWMYEQQNAKRQQTLVNSEKVNKALLNKIEMTKTQNLSLLHKNKEILSSLEKENLATASFSAGFLNVGKRKVKYLKDKLRTSTSIKDVQQFLKHQSDTSYSNVYLLEIHRRLFEITKLVMLLNYSSSYASTLLSLEEIITRLKAEEESGDVSYDNIPLKPAERNIIDEFSITLSNNKLVSNVNKTRDISYGEYGY